MEEIKLKFKSVRFKLFFTMCVVILVIILSLVLINSIVLENFYIYSKTATIKQVYQKVNDYYNTENTNVDLETELKKIAYKNNFDILIKTDTNLIIFTSDREFLSSTYILKDINEIKSKSIEENETKINVKVTTDEVNNISYMFLTGILDNGYVLYIRMPISPIEESVKISNTVLLMIGGITLVVAGIIASFISRKFTNPILQLNDIANKMAKLDFSKKYRITDTEDEINELGRSINTMSDKLEATIKELQKNNIELEKDIEEKSKIDEMRKQFISDVSHELKTPITSIMGYADTLLEEEYDKETQSKFLNVIASEARRMAKLVTDLLTLSKNDNNRNVVKKEQFDLGELVKKCQDKLAIEIKRKNHNVNCFVTADVPLVYADKDDIERVVLNIMTNSIKYTKEGGEIKIYVGFVYNDAYIKIFDNGIGIPEEDLSRIFERFYRVDKARSREMGGTGLGLSIAKDLLDRNGGSIDIKSEVGKGTEVVIKVPTKEK